MAQQTDEVKGLMDSAKVLLQSIHKLLNEKGEGAMTPTDFDNVSAMNEALRITRQIILQKEGKPGTSSDILARWIVSVIAHGTLPHFE